jgi:prepilin-type N-terminal cleavage/methylation domain-containing protein
MKKSNNITAGFTLIELIVTVTIIIILSGISLSAYHQFTQREAAINDARNLSTMLHRVQSMSEYLVYPTGCTNLTGYHLESDCSDGTCGTMSVWAQCDGGPILVVDSEKVLSETSFYEPVNVSFEAGSGNIESVEVYHVSNKYSPFYTVAVTVDAYGNVSRSKPVVSDVNPYPTPTPTSTITPTVTPTSTITPTVTIDISPSPTPSLTCAEVGGSCYPLGTYCTGTNTDNYCIKPNHCCIREGGY